MGVVDPAKLPLLPMTDHDRGDETQVFAADANGAELAVALWPATTPMLALAESKLVTGQVLATSQLAAARSIAAAAGIVPKDIPARKKSIEVNVALASLHQRDLFRLIGDVLRVNVVAGPAPLPDLAIAANHVSAVDLLAAVADLDGLDVVASGITTYLVPRGTKLPKLGPGSQQIELHVRGGNAQQAMAAVQAVASTKLASCDHSPFELDVKKVSLAEALRAIEVASGVPLDAAAKCPIEATTTVDSATLVATAISGDKAAAVITSNGSDGLVKKSKDIEVQSQYITANGVAIQPARTPMPAPPETHDYQKWLAHLVRADAVYRVGTRWFAHLVMTDGDITVTDDRDKNPELADELKRDPPQIAPAGIDVVNPDRSTKTHIPLATKP